MLNWISSHQTEPQKHFTFVFPKRIWGISNYSTLCLFSESGQPGLNESTCLKSLNCYFTPTLTSYGLPNPGAIL